MKPSDAADFLSRELSWLDFDFRVLDEARCPANRLLEKFKFIAIADNNLDEFFMVRVAGLRQLVNSGCTRPDPAGLTPAEQLDLVLRRAKKLQDAARKILEQLRGELARHQVMLTTTAELAAPWREKLRSHFLRYVMPVLTPLVVDASQPFPVLNSGAVILAVEFKEKTGRRRLRRAFVEVPDVLDRLVELDSASGRFLVTLESVILANLDLLFPDGEIRRAWAFRITRDMDFDLADDGVSDLLTSIDRKLQQRRQRQVIRLELAPDSRGAMLAYLMQSLNVEAKFCYRQKGLLKLKSLAEVAVKARRPELLEPKWPPAAPPWCADLDMFAAIRTGNSHLLALPFQQFDPIVRLLEAAVNDPNVLAIKQTLYRVGGNSPVIRALRRAAERGKQVTVVLELKARFDEDNNIHWARLLDESGAHVIYGLPELKVHAKSLLIFRREADGEMRCYYHLGTGNYNDKTARQYTDLGIFGCDPAIGAELSTLFHVLTGAARTAEFAVLACAPFDLRRRFEALIEREIAAVRSGGVGRIVAKMNGFSDERMVRLVHRAADAGVQVQLIVRGICCLRPKPMQKNLRIISIVDRYLEHSRVFYFHAAGAGELYLSSADWMSRNLDRRIELLFPVTEKADRRTVMKMLEFQLHDTDKARELTSDGVYTAVRRQSYSDRRSQARSAAMFAEMSESAIPKAPEPKSV